MTEMDADANTEMNTEVDMKTSVKIGVFRHWTLTWQDIQYEIEEFEYNLEYQRYERDVTQRLIEATEDEKERKHWQKQIARIDKAIANTEADLVKAQKQATYCEAMLAIIRGDLEAEGIDPDDCDPTEYFFTDEFDDEFDDDIPF
jgi:septal ring factor EnvC (AmiA/AmiB activator)